MNTRSNLTSTEQFLKQAELTNCLELREGLNKRISELQSELGTPSNTVQARSPLTPAVSPTGRPKRHMSEDSRRRIQLAQQKRWAEHRRQLAGQAADKTNTESTPTTKKPAKKGARVSKKSAKASAAAAGTGRTATDDFSDVTAN